MSRTAPLIHRIPKPSRWGWGRIEPMSREDEVAWQRTRELHPHLYPEKAR
jgi:hypothetical protein